MFLNVEKSKSVTFISPVQFYKFFKSVTYFQPQDYIYIVQVNKIYATVSKLYENLHASNNLRFGRHISELQRFVYDRIVFFVTTVDISFSNQFSCYLIVIYHLA